ncbi:MAG: major capsid protein [Oscillospiraceae bacterium]|jgi:hypothetical protein|nr:major capsid protein [Oscillospiraceae bacterium]
MATIDIFDSYYLAGLQQSNPPLSTFFTDRYFPTAPADVFNADKVLIEVKDGNSRLAPYVVKRRFDVPVARDGYEVEEYAPPEIKPSRVLTLDDLAQRQMGEALFSDMSVDDRERSLMARDLAELDERITRRVEWQAAQTIINNGFTAVAYADSRETGEAFDLFFYKTGGGNPALYTVSDPWDNGGDYDADVAGMARALSRRGLPAADLVLGSDAASFILNDDKLLKKLDISRLNVGELAPALQSPGVVFLGKLVFGGFSLNVISVDAEYTDDDGAIQPFFPAKSALVTAPGCGHTMYARVRQMNDSKAWEEIAAPRAPLVISTVEGQSRKLRLTARPLCAPKAKAPWMYAENAVM